MPGDLRVPVATVYAPEAMVVSADALATSSGLRILGRGGTAADAAVAANAVLAVTAPHMCGLGGDLFALVHTGQGPPTALNASGHAGSGADPDRLRAEGFDAMPFRLDVRSVTVPGCVDGWLALHARFGRLDMVELLADAIALANGGFPASPLLVGSLQAMGTPAPAAAELAAQAHRPGDLVRRPGAARALAAIAEYGRSGFYGGDFGAGLLTVGAGEFTDEDLATSQAEWVDPLGVDALAHTIWTMPPNSQGYLTLAGAWMASRLQLPDPALPAWAHLLVEASRRAGFDRPDVLHDGADGAALLSEGRLSARLATIDPHAASLLPSGSNPGDTTYLCAVDGEGMGVSLIQSNAAGFGSHLFEPSTGINLHNRGIGFSLAADHPAEYGPRRRPPHTLSPAVVTGTDGVLTAVVGTQGGDAQPQILLQVLARLLVAGESPARAIASPRWILAGGDGAFSTWASGTSPAVVVEEQAATMWSDGLASLGHRVVVGPAFDSQFGHANLIVVDPRGVLAGAADPRARIGLAAGR